MESGDGPRPNDEDTMITIEEIKALSRAEARGLASIVRRTRASGHPRAALAARDVEVSGIDEQGDRLEAAVWTVALEGLTLEFLNECAGQARAAGATTLSLEGGWDVVGPDLLHIPLVGDFGVEVDL